MTLLNINLPPAPPGDCTCLARLEIWRELLIAAESAVSIADSFPQLLSVNLEDLRLIMDSLNLTMRSPYSHHIPSDPVRVSVYPLCSYAV